MVVFSLFCLHVVLFDFHPWAFRCKIVLLLFTCVRQTEPSCCCYRGLFPHNRRRLAWRRRMVKLTWRRRQACGRALCSLLVSYLTLPPTPPPPPPPPTPHPPPPPPNSDCCCIHVFHSFASGSAMHLRIVYLTGCLFFFSCLFLLPLPLFFFFFSFLYIFITLLHCYPDFNLLRYWTRFKWNGEGEQIYLWSLLAWRRVKSEQNLKIMKENHQLFTFLTDNVDESRNDSSVIACWRSDLP